MGRFLDRLMEGEGGAGGAGGAGASGTGAGAGGAGAGGTGAAGAGTGGAAGTGAGAGAGTGAAPTWIDGFAPDLKGYVETKGFKDPGAVVEAYRNFEKLHGVPRERLLKLPEKDDDAVGWGEVHTRLGRPDKPDAYDVKLPDGVAPEFADFYKKTAHELGLSKKQGDAFAKKWAEHITGEMTKANESEAISVQQQQSKLKTEWGAAHDQNVAQAKKAALAFGISGEQIDQLQGVMGFDGVMKFMHTLGSKVGEDPFVHGGGNGGNGFGMLSPDAARGRLSALKSDPAWVKRYTEGGHQETAEMERLLRMSIGQAPH